MKPEERWVDAKILGDPSLCSPSVRTVMVFAWAWTDESGAVKTEHEFAPVVAIQAVRVSRYGKPTPVGTYPDRPATHSQARRDGWAFEGNDMEVNAIVWDHEYGDLVTVDAETRDSNRRDRMATCPWPVDEDEARLASIVAELVKEAVELHETRRARAEKNAMQSAATA